MMEGVRGRQSSLRTRHFGAFGSGAWDASQRLPNPRLRHPGIAPSMTPLVPTSYSSRVVVVPSFCSTLACMHR